MRNVLVVEDDVVLRVLTKSLLTKSKYEFGNIYEAANGRAGLDLLRRYSIDLLLTDINMPEMDGLEMLAYIRAHPGLQEVPTVIMTSEDSSDMKKMITQCGFGFVGKPFDWKVLYQQIEKVEENNVSYIYR